MMTFLSQYIALAVAAIFAENFIFTKALGADELLRVVNRPRNLFQFGLLLTVMTSVSSVLGWVADHFLSGSTQLLYRSVLYILVLAALYLIAAPLLKRFAPRLYSGIYRALPMATFNCAVLGAPLVFLRMRAPVLNMTIEHNFLGAVVFGLGSGLGYILATVLVYEGFKRLEVVNLPAAFKGMPARILYIGILSMAFFGLSGQGIIV